MSKSEARGDAGTDRGLVSWQRLEGAVVFVAGLVIYVMQGQEFVWWIAVLLLFAPDLSFVAYLLGPRFGAVGYNLVHVYAFGALFLALGMTSDSASIQAVGVLWLAHSGFDRMLGYGLKSARGFTLTHLGRVGKP